MLTLVLIQQRCQHSNPQKDFYFVQTSSVGGGTVVTAFKLIHELKKKDEFTLFPRIFIACYVNHLTVIEEVTVHACLQNVKSALSTPGGAGILSRDFTEA